MAIRIGNRLGGAVVAVALGALAGVASAQPVREPTVPCRNDGNFEHWIEGVKQEALEKGVKRDTIATVLKGIQFDPKIIARDRRQGVFFLQSFLQFSDRVIDNHRLVRGRQEAERHSALFARIERDFGVPTSVLVALWGGWKVISALPRVSSRRSVHWPRSPMIAADRRSSACNLSTHCA